jgi:hypothetical protein
MISFSLFAICLLHWCEEVNQGEGQQRRKRRDFLLDRADQQNKERQGITSFLITLTKEGEESSSTFSLVVTITKRASSSTSSFYISLIVTAKSMPTQYKDWRMKERIS